MDTTVDGDARANRPARGGGRRGHAQEVCRCAGCGHSSAKWFGRCPGCGSWETAVSGTAAGSSATVLPLGAAGSAPIRFSSGIDEVDRVLGGGLVEGEVALVAGEPGIGKSTIVLQVLSGVAAAGRKTLLLTGEESIAQVGMRAARLGASSERLRAAAVQSLDDVLAVWDAELPDVVVIDSIQTLEDPSLEQAAGSVTQVRECAARVVRQAKATGAVVLLVSHVTKDGSVAGPKTLEHVVDVVLLIEGERGGELRLLRPLKNRFGSCEDTGVFVMTSGGMEAVADPSALLLADRCVGNPGSVVFPSMEGSRPVLTEIQALVAATNPGQARRVATGVDPRRLALLLGVLSKRAGIKLPDHDVFVAAAGGLAVREPAADLAIALAISSTSDDVPAGDKVVAMGEIGLGGEVRRVPAIERRLGEARRLGFETALVPRGMDKNVRGIEVIEVQDVVGAIAYVRGAHLDDATPSPRSRSRSC